MFSMAKKTRKTAPPVEIKHLITSSTELHRLATLPEIKGLPPKRHKKLLKQIGKLDRAIAKMNKLVK